MVKKRPEPRQRIIEAALDILGREGREAVTTRSVSQLADVQPPTIYRLFGDMTGLLGEVTAVGFETYLASKTARRTSTDPVDDLRAGWDLHVEFGVANPALYVLMYGGAAKAEPGGTASRAQEILHGLVSRIAEAGRLTTDIARAAQMVHAAGMGTTLSLISMPAGEREMALSTDVREGIIAAITSAEQVPVRETAQHASALQASLSDVQVALTEGERMLLGELLTRVAQHPARP